MRYAVKKGSFWFVAVKVKASEYGVWADQLAPTGLVWSDTRFTSYICPVGEEDKQIELD